MVVHWLTAFIDRSASGMDAAVRFWSRVTAGSLSAPRGERGEFATFLPDDGDAFLRVQTLLEGSGGTHLDLHVPDVEAAAERAVALGAQAQPRDGYVSLRSPAGLPCCLVPDHVAVPRRPGPVTRDAGHCSLVDQVCVDVPPGSYDAEVAFWQEITGWQLRPGSRPEFAYLVRPAHLPLRILLQRLDDSPGDAPATCHLDLACTDVAAEAALHESWGAEVVARFPDWTTLADPTGAAYCLTRRDPATGTLPS
jgi:predicted enzyme related to lactoylglutathione lyase